MSLQIYTSARQVHTHLRCMLHILVGEVPEVTIGIATVSVAAPVPIAFTTYSRQFCRAVVYRSSCMCVNSAVVPWRGHTPACI
eukprot:14676-Eustigmatos_ZCMA.PRE.1